jgi:hypothetical protein
MLVTDVRRNYTLRDERPTSRGTDLKGAWLHRRPQCRDPYRLGLTLVASMDSQIGRRVQPCTVRLHLI